MIDNEGNVIKYFESLTDACKFFGVKGQQGELKRAADAFTKKGLRKKYFGNY